MRLAFVGDVMLGREVAEQIPYRSPESFWGDTLPVLRQADLVIANLECAITDSRVPWTRTTKVFHFRAPPQATGILTAARVRLVSLANNHILDFEEQGLSDTIRYLDDAGIAHAGAGCNALEAQRPAVVDVDGTRVGLVAFTDNEPDWAARNDSPGTHFLPINTDPETLSRVENAVREARAAGADFVVLSLHWGPNMVQRPSPAFVEFAHAAIERGTDLVFGHSLHVFQGIELVRDRPIFYDTGDFLDDYAVDPLLRNDWSFIFLVDTDAHTVQRIELVPARLFFSITNLAVGAEADAIIGRMRALAREMGTHLRRIDTRLVWPDTADRSRE